MYAYRMPIEPRTTRGLRWCMVAFGVYIILMIIQVVFAAWISVALSGIGGQTPSNQISSLLMMALLLVVIIGIVGVLVIVFYFVGFGDLYAGRDELGARHSKNVWLSFLFIIGAMVAYVVGAISQLFVSFSLFGTDLNSAESMKDFMTKQIAASSISGGIVAAFVAAAVSLSILALIAPGRRPLVFTAAIIGTATPGIVGVLGLLQISALVDRLFHGNTGGILDSSIGLPTMVGGSLGIITFLIFIFAYNQVYGAIKKGELRPIVKQPQPVWVPTPYFVPTMPYQPYQPVQPPYSPPPQSQSPMPAKPPPEQQ